jgi:mutator protein MutT
MEVVGAIIKNASNEYLLQQRDENAPTFKHEWTLFGGKVEEGEQPEEALLRELDEELRLDPQDIESITLVQTNTDENGTVQYVFEIITNVPIEALVLGEGEAMEYVPEASLFDRTYAFNIEAVLASYIKKNK